MKTTTIPVSATRFINYLKANGGKEIQEFAEISEARSFAEKLREIHKDYLDSLISVEQSYNKVTVTVLP